MSDNEKIIAKLQDAAAYFRSGFDAMYGTVACEKYRNWTDAIEQAIALLKEYDDALKLMVYQYCTMKPLTVHDEVFHNKFMSAGEAAFRLLGLENGQSTDGVWERWFPNG